VAGRGLGAPDDGPEPVLPHALGELADDGELVAAGFALVVLVEVPPGDVEAEALDGDAAAPRAVGVLQGVARDVADVDVPEADLLGHLAVLFEGGDGGHGEVHHLVVRMPAEEVDGHVGAEEVVDELGELAGFVQVVPHLGHDEVRDLHVDVGLLLEVSQGVEDGLGVGDADVASYELLFSAALEVDGDAVQKVLHHVHRLGGVVAVGDEDVDEPVLPGDDADVVGVFDEDRGLIVGVGDTVRSISKGHLSNLLRGCVEAFNFSSLRDIVVLAIRTVVHH
jgi:hypothetical protein